MIDKHEVRQAKADGKKIVLRIDNAVRNSRNRNTGMTRMYDFAQIADLVIYQSQWAKDYLMPFIKKDGVVILNSCDLGIYHPPSTEHIDYETNYLYSRFNRDETKNWEVARYWFSRNHTPSAKLYIVGNFSEELRAGNFDFYNGEQFSYLGSLPEQEMADLYRNCKKFIYTYYNDACSNTLIEALCSGMQIVGDKYYRNTGGAIEIREAWRQNKREYFGLDRMKSEYSEALDVL